MSISTIAVAGGGIAGLTAALLLSRAGFRIDVFERAERFSEVGAGLQISPNAGRILDNLGLGSALDAVATRPEAIEMRGGQSGRLVVSLPLARAAIRYGAPYRLLHRSDLLEILLAAVAADANIAVHLESPVGNIHETADGVRFTAGSSTCNADVLIGADGVRSAIRAHLRGGPAEPTGRTAWRTTIPASAAPAGFARDRVTVFLGDRSHVVIYPIRAGREINIVAIVEEAWQGAGWNEPGDSAFIRQRFRGMAADLEDLIVAGRDWTRWCLSGVDANGPWQRGRIALVGDACHAMLPFLAQGAAMAIEDAAVLTRMLLRQGLPAEIALERYVAERRPRAARVAQAARQSGAIYHMSPLAAPFRDATMRALGGDRLLAHYDWIYGWRQSG
ncbi:MAG TPA: FAD-dependent monooxygenase [Kaistia sp.]|nr:FAD-dependent monooxygenase [Kaistia sp.]